MAKKIKKAKVGKYYILKSYENIAYDYPYFNRLMVSGWSDRKPKKCKAVGVSGNIITFEGVSGGCWDYHIKDLRELTKTEEIEFLRNIKDEVYFGIEIESLFRAEKLNFGVGGYHNGNTLNSFWEAQSDSSIYPNNEHNNNGYEEDEEEEYCDNCDSFSCDCYDRGMYREIDYYTFRGIEFVSKKINGIKDFDNTIKNFKELVFEKVKIGSDLYFNKSCGCHIHIGFNKGRKIRDKLTFDRLVKVRNTFFKLVDSSSVLSESTKQKVKDNYFRDYAQKITERDWLRSSLRSGEFNLSGENMGLEWRSFNICGVSSWEEFLEMFEIAKKSLSCLIRDRIKGYRTRKKSVKFTKEEIKKFTKNPKQEIKIKNNEVINLISPR